MPCKWCKHSLINHRWCCRSVQELNARPSKSTWRPRTSLRGNHWPGEVLARVQREWPNQLVPRWLRHVCKKESHCLLSDSRWPSCHDVPAVYPRDEGFFVPKPYQEEELKLRHLSLTLWLPDLREVCATEHARRVMYEIWFIANSQKHQHLLWYSAFDDWA